ARSARAAACRDHPRAPRCCRCFSYRNRGGRGMKVEVTITRVYEMDEERVLAEPAFDPPSPDTPYDEKRSWLRESFWELCGFDRDHDHVDGAYVWLVDEDDDADFWWPRTGSASAASASATGEDE